LQESGLVAKMEYVMPSQPSKEAITATGATFRSDGRVLVIYLVPDEGPFTTPPPVTPSTPENKNSSSIFDGLLNPR
jgi:hypothetical protein